jgi:hypothetical protein
MMRDFLYYMQLGIEAVMGEVGIGSYEEPPNVIIDTLANVVEVRRYETRLAAEVRLPEAAGKAGADEAFGILFNYISGQNSSANGSEKIAMTVPVEVAGRGEKLAINVPVESATTPRGTHMRFFLPAHLVAEIAPKPNDPRVRLVKLPAATVAVLRFSGTADESEISRRQAMLLAKLVESRWRATAQPVMLFYDAPFTLPFLRRNEAAVEVEPR